MGEKTEVRISTILSFDHDFNAYNANEQHATHLHHKNLNICLTPISTALVWNGSEFQQGLLGYSSPHYHLLFYIGYLSRAFTLLILYPPYPYSLLNSLAICLLSYPTHLPFVVLCYRILIVLHHTCIHDLLFFRCVLRHAQAKNWHHFLKTAAFLIAWQVRSYFFLPFQFFLYFSSHPSHSFYHPHRSTHRVFFYIHPYLVFLTLRYLYSLYLFPFLRFMLSK